MFDAIAEITGADPKLNGRHIGHVKKALCAAEPPYTPEEVRRFPAVFRQQGMTVAITLGVVEKYVSWVRTPPGGLPGVATAETEDECRARKNREAEEWQKQPYTPG